MVSFFSPKEAFRVQLLAPLLSILDRLNAINLTVEIFSHFDNHHLHPSIFGVQVPAPLPNELQSSYISEKLSIRTYEN